MELPRYSSFQEACQAVAELEAAAAQGLAPIDEESEDEAGSEEGGGGSEGSDAEEEEGLTEGEAGEEEAARWGAAGRRAALGLWVVGWFMKVAVPWNLNAQQNQPPAPLSQLHSCHAWGLPENPQSRHTHTSPPATQPSRAAAAAAAKRRLEDDGDDEVAVLRGGASRPVEVDEEFERDFAQLMQDYQGARPAVAAGGSRPGPQFGGEPPAAAAAGSSGGGGGEGPENAMVFKVGWQGTAWLLLAARGA